MSFGFSEFGHHSDDIEHVKMHPEDELGLNKDRSSKKTFSLVSIQVLHPSRCCFIVNGSSITSGILNRIGYEYPKICAELHDDYSNKNVEVEGYADLIIKSRIVNHDRSFISNSVTLIVFDIALNKNRDATGTKYDSYVIHGSYELLYSLVDAFMYKTEFNNGIFDVK